MFSQKFSQRFLFLTLAFTLSGIWLTQVVSAQTVTGTLQGTVSDSKGAMVPGADVVIRNVETGQERVSEQITRAHTSLRFFRLDATPLPPRARVFARSLKRISR